MKRYWLFKSEPESYAIDDLARDRVTIWDGVRNYQARNTMRDDMKKGDLALFYHSNAEPPAAVGVVEVSSRRAVVDPTQFDPDSPYFDAKSTPDAPRWVGVEIRFKKAFKKPVSLAAMRADPELSALSLLQKGQRLSVLPLSEAEFERICRMGT